MNVKNNEVNLMSDPKEHKELWKNCNWINAEEKLAFFNHYFKNSKMVMDRIDNEVKAFKIGLAEFIKENKIRQEHTEKDGKSKTRPVTLNDVLERIRVKE